MIICAGRLDSVALLENASIPARVIVQWNEEDCADMKIIEIDLLGLGMMAVLRDAMALVKKHERRELALHGLSDKDPVVLDALQRADTIGMFQVESRAHQASLPRARPERFTMSSCKWLSSGLAPSWAA